MRTSAGIGTDSGAGPRTCTDSHTDSGTDSGAGTDPELTRIVSATLAGPPRLGTVRLVCVDGPSGSGKSTLGRRLASEFTGRRCAAALVPTDHFATWDVPLDWWPRLEQGVLGPFAAGRPASYLANDWSDGEPVPTLEVVVPVPRILILEGVSAGRAAVRDRSTTVVWVEHADRAQRLERAVARDGEQIRPFLGAWQAAEDAWFAVDETSRYAQHVIVT